jgi:hypothetical protein
MQHPSRKESAATRWLAHRPRTFSLVCNGFADILASPAGKPSDESCSSAFGAIAQYSRVRKKTPLYYFAIVDPSRSGTELVLLLFPIPDQMPKQRSQTRGLRQG